VDRHLNLIDEETTALQKGNRCAGQIPSRGRSGKPVEIGGSVAGYSVPEIGQTHYRRLETPDLERLRERLSLKGSERQCQQDELEHFRNRLEDKTTERKRMLG